MKLTKLKKILETLEKLGFGDEYIGADHNVIKLIYLEQFDELPRSSQEALCGKCDVTTGEYKIGLGCYRDDDSGCLCCDV